MSEQKNQLSAQAFESRPLQSIVPRDEGSLKQLAKYAAKLIPVPPNTSTDDHVLQVAAKIGFGLDVGIPPFVAAKELYIIKGALCMSSQLCMAQVRQSGLCERLSVNCSGEGDQLIATATGERSDTKETATVIVKFADIKARNLHKYTNGKNKETWQNYPERMLEKKAAAALCRNLWPEVVLGLHTREEIIDGDAEVVDLGVAQTSSVPQARRLGERDMAGAQQPAEDTEQAPEADDVEFTEEEAKADESETPAQADRESRRAERTERLKKLAAQNERQKKAAAESANSENPNGRTDDEQR